MIPLHRPAFGIGTVLAASLTGGGKKSLQQLEEAYATATRCAYTVWLPSARAGIGWALRASVDAETRVIGPAFTCGVVHEAMARSGGQVHLLDTPADDFLVNPESIAPLQRGNHAIVLCEVYGHTYNLARVASVAQSSPTVRIVDMAMAVPQPSLGQRLLARDFAVISFGTGKSMYAGWGAMGFTPNATLANEVRRLRDEALIRGDSCLLLLRSVATAARVVGSHPSVYALAKRLKDWKQRGSVQSTSRHEVLPTEAGENRQAWQLPSTRLDCGLALWNLKHARAFHEARLALARHYANRLASTPGLVCPKKADEALSHFTVRVRPEIRNILKQELYELGINTITLWEFPAHLDRNQFPQTHRISLEVLNLPLSPWMSARDVDFICEKLIHCFRACSAERRTK